MEQPDSLEQIRAGEAFKKLPLKQRLYLEYKEKLASLALEYPHIAYSIADEGLAGNLGDVIEKVGFASHPANVTDARALIKNVAMWLRKGRLVLLHHRPKPKEPTLVDILRELKKLVTPKMFSALIPVFMGAASSRKQLEAFQVLGIFGIQYACFITFGAAPERQTRDLLQGLEEYGILLKNDFVLDKGTEQETRGLETIVITRYREQMSRGDELMKSGDYEAAIECFTTAIDMKPNFNILMKRGDAYYRNRQFMPALQDFREASKLETGKADPYAKVGSCCFSLAKEVAKKEGPQAAKKWLTAGVKHVKQAVQIIDTIVQKNRHTPEKLPKVPYAVVISALSDSDIRGLGNREEEKMVAQLSVEVLGKTTQTNYLDPSLDAEERISEAMLLARNKQYEKAEDIFRQVIHESLDNAGPAFNNFAVELRKNGQYGKAFEIYLELLKYDIPDREIVIENCKTAGLKYRALLLNMHKKEEAAAVYAHLLRYNPELAKQDASTGV